MLPFWQLKMVVSHLQRLLVPLLEWQVDSGGRQVFSHAPER